MENVLSESILMATAAAVELEPEQIPRDWILSGSPQASSKTLTRSGDGHRIWSYGNALPEVSIGTTRLMKLWW